eukprot:scaffold40827_cov88-Cyclotella_meneghiniana.AAC.2
MRFILAIASAGMRNCLLLLSVPFISSFSHFNQRPHLLQHNVHHDDEIDGFDHQQTNSIFQSDVQALGSKRRNFFSKVTATTAVATAFSTTVSSATPAYAVTEEPTRIELVVETDYLIRVLNYFDGDMRKVLGAIVRSPLTNVEIEPPRAKFNFGGETSVSPKDAILRALYSKDTPEINEEQKSWLKVDPPNPWIEFLTKKRYELSIPFFYMKEGEQKGSIKKIVVRPATTLTLSNIEAAIGVAAISYTVAYAFYNYESYAEEQEKLAKKRMIAAKKKAKSASKGAVKKGEASTDVKGSDAKAPKKKAMKGEISKDKKAKKPFPKKPILQSEQEEATVAPNAMTEALNEVFGTKPGITAVISEVDPSTQVKPPKFQKQQSELIDNLVFVEDKSSKEAKTTDKSSEVPKLTVEPDVKVDVKEELPSPPPEINESMYSAARKVKSGDGGMSAYDAQMKAMMNKSN